MQLENYEEALGLYARLVKQFPQGGLWAEYGRAAAILGDFNLAEQNWEQVRKLGPNTADHLSRIAAEYYNIRMYSKARELYLQAANIEPRNLEAQLSLAWILARTNSVDEVRAVVNRCLELDSRNEQALYLSAQLNRRENKLADAERQFRDLIASAPRHPLVRYSCHFELAQILDRTERFDEAMTQLAEGKRLAPQAVNAEAKRKTFEEWHEEAVRKTKSLPNNILETWGKSYPPRARAPAAPLAFLGGSARSGTTLLEKILDAHPAVSACDESLAFPVTLSSIDIAAPAIPAQRLNVLRQRYMKILTKLLGPIGNGTILLDKNPTATVYLPAFLRAFPELRTLIGLRDPRDVMVSLYFQNQPRSNYLTFERLAQHYRCVMDAWLAVREWQGLVWMETRYEDIVADVQKEGSRITKFLGLEWHENQARFYESNREKPIMSTNYNDVTQPVYARSVGRWQIYEKHLAPVLPVLEPYCRRFGYA
jgi:tetratricopeptide (TPR) repeat protein